MKKNIYSGNAGYLGKASKGANWDPGSQDPIILQLWFMWGLAHDP